MQQEVRRELLPTLYVPCRAGGSIGGVKKGKSETNATDDRLLRGSEWDGFKEEKVPNDDGDG